MPQKSKARSHLMLQVVGLGYVAYLIFQMAASYMHGEWDIPSRTFMLIIGAMTAAEIVLAIFSFRAWRRDRKKELEDEENASE